MTLILTEKRKTWSGAARTCGAATVVASLIMIGAPQAPSQGAEASPDKRLQNATLSFSEVMHEPDKGIPRDLFDKSRCIVIIHGVKKAAFIVGGKYGLSFVSCRRDG